MLSLWEQRPFEIANLLNPAFCSIVLRDSISSFHGEMKRNMPYPLVFLVLPLVLHKPTRDTFPKRTDTKFYEWIEDNPNILVTFAFAERTRQFVPYTKETLIFGMKQKIFNIDAQGNLKSLRAIETPWSPESKPALIRKKAKFLGRWFAKSGDTAKIFRWLGVLP